MKRRASLVLIELVIMLLVFSLAAALCVQAFVWADSRSRQSIDADMALMQVQNAAELLKHHRGDFTEAAGDFGGMTSDTTWVVSYDESWSITTGKPVYTLHAEQIPSEMAFLGRAKLTLLDQNGTVLAELTVCWQEVTP